MNATTKQLYESALSLPERERAELAAWLIDSLDPEFDCDVHVAWGDEIKSRLEELDRSAVTAVPWPEARRMILGLSDGPTVD